MDADELDERIRRLEAQLGLAEPAAWPDPNRLAAPQPWIDAFASPPPITQELARHDVATEPDRAEWPGVEPLGRPVEQGQLP
jgi:hypothetical protein